MRNRYALCSGLLNQNEKVLEYIKTHKDTDRVWVDLDKNKVFGYSTKMEKENQVPGAFNSGGWYSFHFSPETWAQHANDLYETFFRNASNLHCEPIVSDELLHSSASPHLDISGSKCLVVGGGPTTKENIESIVKISNDYDIRATCNHFFLNQELFQIKFDYIFLSLEVDLKSPLLLEYIRNNNPVVAFEHGPVNRLKEIYEFSRKNKVKTLFYITRYFSRLGYTSRQIVFLGLNGAKAVDFIGLDGFTSSKVKHSFETNKAAPGFYDTEKYHRLGIIFWDYLLNNKILKNCDFNNLSDGNEKCLFSNYKKMVKEGQVFV
tara:strand:+ start:960 stop:1919 length:960 start_codon:yes stop_codon:yes gene_type:complete